MPFFSLSASEFIEMIVGVGASRVRDLFKEARAAPPAIIFIDELNAIGRTRGTGAQLGGHDEREQTLNQILTEMDGFDSREGVIVLAATNRVDVLDQALLRPGRFDRRVVVQRPDRAGRAAEQLVYGVVTTGAEHDLQQVTEIARHMVLRWGMSKKLGPISFAAPQDDGLPPAFQHQPYSEATAELIDAEVRRIVEESHREADRRLAEHRDKLDALALALLNAESLNEKEIRDVVGLAEHPSQEDAEETITTTGTDEDAESWENEGGYVPGNDEGESAWGNDEGPWEG